MSQLVWITAVVFSILSIYEVGASIVRFCRKLVRIRGRILFVIFGRGGWRAGLVSILWCRGR